MSLRDKLNASVGKRKVAWALRPELLLCPQIPKPMHGMAPRTILGKDWWEKTRRAAFNSTNDHCVACGVHRYSAAWHQWLEGHELYDIDYLLGRMTYVETVPLCHSCHSFIHDGLLAVRLDMRQISRKQFDAIMKHGRALLKKAGLDKKAQEHVDCADWKDWRLVLNGKEYAPKYDSFEKWKKWTDGLNEHGGDGR